MPLVLFSHLTSPPARASNLVLKALNIPYKQREIDTHKHDQFDEYFQKVNPQHTIPTLQDGELIMWDSHAINTYLVNQYAKDDSLYPKNPKIRALIDQRLHFDSGVLFPAIPYMVNRIFFKKNLTSVTEGIISSFEYRYNFVEKFLSGKNKYAVGNNITLADFSFVTSLTTMHILVPIDQQKYPLIKKYLELLKSQLKSYEEINEKGLEECNRRLKNANFMFLKEEIKTK
ncbi:glutathione S-transferase 1-like isoform X1 [Planococcus citri]|uniref:glutathione S-transferase 1-like isoform X1 n=1 Tax=Planococcus citri TaxID=170843 RepID=UPI0031F8E439